MNSKIFLFIFLATFVFPKPMNALSIGSNERKVINIQLQTNPTAALAIVSVGDPPVEVKLHMDTGLQLTWVLTNPKTRYNPSASFSFTHKSCQGLRANFLIRTGSRNSPCRFKIQLGDRAFYEGTIGEETFTYSTGYRGLSTVESVYFGVGETKNGVQVGKGSLGLGLGQLSILNHFDQKFSICIGNFNEMNKGRHFLALGDDAFLTGQQVPINTQGGQYVLPMTSITISGKNIGLRDVLVNSVTYLDAGTSEISLVSRAFYVVLEEINRTLSVTGVGPLYMYDQLFCQDGTIPKHLDIELGLGFGDVTINFPTKKLFFQLYDDVFCLHVSKSLVRQNLIGIPAFQGNNIAIDVPNQKMYVKAIDCDVLFDGYKDELGHPNP